MTMGRIGWAALLVLAVIVVLILLLVNVVGPRLG